MVQIYCHVLISQYPQEFLPPSHSILRKSLSTCGKGSEDQAQAKLYLLPKFPGSTFPGTGRSLACWFCAKTIPNALATRWPDSLHRHHFASQRGCHLKGLAHARAKSLILATPQQSRDRLEFSKVPKKKFKGNQRHRAEFVPGLSGLGPFLRGAHTQVRWWRLPPGLLVSQLLSNYHVKSAMPSTLARSVS